MNVIMIGFSNMAELDAVMQKLINDSQCYLFYVMVTAFGSVAYQWAQQYGAPIKFMKGTMDAVLKDGDYLVAKFDGSSQMRLLINRWRETGKHGTIIGWQ